jgi:hypothetical protein
VARFSVGGDAAPPPNPGVGTQPLALLPNTGYKPGAPLPGSTLNYTDSGGFVTVEYHLHDPVTSDENLNFFVLGFKLIHPIVINLARSTVTYYPDSSGRDFTELAFSCGDVAYGSNTPTMGITVGYVVPEPETWAQMLLGFGGIGFLKKRATRSRWMRGTAGSSALS